MARTGMLRLLQTSKFIPMMAALVLLAGAAFCATAAPQAARALTDEDVLLVVAPHPDDEVISSLCLMLEAKRAGAEVHVLYLTNGEYPAPSALANRDRDSGGDNAFVALGYARQRESSAIMGQLGADSLTFLGYPDSFLHDMAGPAHWRADGVLSSRTKRREVPFEESPSLGKLNTGLNLLGDICLAISASKPDIIIAPSTDDAHPDHSAAGLLTLIAAEWCAMGSSGSYMPRVWSYLVHVRDIGWNTGYRAREEKLPMPWMEGDGRSWISFQASEQDARVKKTAVLSFLTQAAAINRTLLSFIRQNELFCEIGPLAQSSAGGVIESELPSAETFERSAHPAADIIRFSIEAAASEMRFSARLGGEPSGRYCYILRAYYTDAEGSVVDVSEVKVRGDAGKISAASSEGALRAGDVKVHIEGNKLKMSLPLHDGSKGSLWVTLHSAFSIGDAILDRTPVVKFDLGK